VEPDGSTTTTTTSTTNNGGSTSNASSATTASTSGSAVSNFYDTTKQSKSNLLDLQMSASGVRQSPTVTNIGAFVAPTLATSFQIGEPTAQ
jgi:hypothetical protein